MAMFKSIATLALKNVVEGTVIAMGGEFAAGLCEQVGGKVAGYFRDPSRVVLTTLQKAAEQALDTVEGALAGSGLLGCAASGEVKGLRNQLESLLQQAELGGRPLDRGWRLQCLQEWKAARKSGLFAVAMDERSLEAALDPFARFSNQADLVAAEEAALRDLESVARAAGRPKVAEFLSIRPGGGSNLFALAVQHHFQSAIPKDHALFATLTHAQLNGLSDRQRAILDELRAARADFQGLKARFEERLKEELSQRQPRIGDGLTIRGGSELKLMTEFRERLRSLPPELLDTSDLETLARGFHCAGKYDSATPLLEIAAGLATEDRERARSLYTAFINTLERRDLEKAKRFAEATKLLREALALDTSLVPFDVKQYPVLSVLGAGGFGVVVLCGYGRYSQRRSVFKILRTDGLDRDPEALMQEAELLATIEHPNVIKVLDAKVGEVSDGTSVPYLELDYFEGVDLESYVVANGPFAPHDAMEIGFQIACGLSAAHSRGIWHRDVKPANAMIRKVSSGYEVKLIDFGLAARHDEIDLSLTLKRASDRTSIVADSVIGTLDYAAPEQLGTLPGVSVGPYSDVYGLGRTLCYLLVQRRELRLKEQRDLPSALVELIDECLEEQPKSRFGGGKADQVRDRLEGLLRSRLSTSSAARAATPTISESVRSKKAQDSTATERLEINPPQAPAELIAKRARTDSASAASAVAGYDAYGQRWFEGLRPLGKNRQSGLFEYWMPASGNEPARNDGGHFRVEDDSAIVMVLIPGGTFWMGAQKRDRNQPNYDSRAYDDESPVERVALDSYFLAKYPLTQGQWKNLTGINPAANRRQPSHRDRPLSYPIENVSWDDCSQVLAKIGLVLPTEAQWEYACRADTSTPWWQSDESTLKKVAAVEDSSGGHTVLVDSLAANPFGLFHVHGNVWEWCQDGYQPYSVARPRAGDGLRSWSGPRRVLRGGCYSFSAMHARSAYRYNFDPGTRSCNLGCRPARVAT